MDYNSGITNSESDKNEVIRDRGDPCTAPVGDVTDFLSVLNLWQNYYGKF